MSDWWAFAVTVDVAMLIGKVLGACWLQTLSSGG
jgi:hypothetical protein